MMNLAALFGGSTRYFTTKVAGAARPLTSLALNSTVKLNSGASFVTLIFVICLAFLLTSLPQGYEMPRLGFGVFQNDHATPAVKEALKAGYRYLSSYFFTGPHNNMNLPQSY
jgi:hypothetical protein